MKNKKENPVILFLKIYGWAILSAIITIGVIWYMVGSPDFLKFDRECLAEKVCEDLNAEYDWFNGRGVFCNFNISYGVYYNENFDVNYTKLKEIYPECENE